MLFKHKRFALTGDLHIENNKNLPFVLKSVDWIIEALLTQDIKCLFILGDFINSREKIDSLALNKAVDVLNLFQKHDIEVFLLLGNHERYTKATNFDITSIKPFERHSHLLTDFKTLHGDGFNLICIPNLETNEEFITIIDSIKPDKTKLNILLGHHGIQGAITNDLFNIYDKNGVSSNLFGKFDRVFLGHYHRRQEIQNILYVGTPVQLSHGEELSDKGITIWDAKDNSLQFIKYPNYQVYTTISNLDEDVDNKFVRYVTTEFIDNTETKKIKEELKQRGAIDVKIEVKSPKFEQVSDTGTTTEFDLNEMVKNYIDKNAGELDKTKCLTCYTAIREDTVED